MWNNKQHARWSEILKFEPTSTHLTVWTQKVEKAIKLQEYLSGLNMEKLKPLWEEGNNQKHAAKPPEPVTAAPILKAVWRRIMEFAPTPWHLGLLQRMIEKDLGVDAYFKKIDVEGLLDIVREVAMQPIQVPTKPTTSAQPNLNMEVK